MLKNYRDSKAVAQCRGKANTKFSLSEYKEKVYTAVEARKRGKRKLMWKDEAIEYWMSVKGGRTDKQQN